MTSRDIRKAFLDYFAEREHRVVPSSPLILPNDPTLLFANAGMNQFKDVFTGREHRDYSRAVSSQKCLRVSGKHNDLETVGRTPRHHTFFEMLGNFSFGDYFKREAIAFAWEFMTRTLALPEDRLWVTVFAGTDALPADEEALRLWRDDIGVRPERILALGESENFWRMGESGPCGPCSELHYDLGADLTSVSGVSNPGTDERRFIEIWNLVFMQFNQKSEGTLEALPAPSIDTGMGLERIAAILQSKRSNFETDLFVPVIEATATRAGVSRGKDEGTEFSLRVIADHARALCFLVADGVVPANDKRGYVLRRLLRRAIRHGRKLGITEPFLEEITPVIIEGLGDVYPELIGAREAILAVGQREERRFAETLSTGLEMLDQSIAALPADRPVLAGKELFRLYDTFGFPLDLARDIAEERDIRLDEAGFEAEMAKQRTRAQASWKGSARSEDDAAQLDLARKHSSTFEGYGATRLDGARVVAMLGKSGSVPLLEDGEEGEVALDATPFYAQAGGQLADTGQILGPSGRARVLDVQRIGGRLSLHHVRVDAGSLGVGQEVVAEVDGSRRVDIRRNHTATHLLHAALREVVGTHVKQAGSLVAADRLRFDFSHFAGLTEGAIDDIESLINRNVLADLPVETNEMELQEALDSGAMALFGERYTERVRVVRIGDFSMELCGGTHTSRTGELGLVKLIQEKGIASGTRRIEAISGNGSIRRFRLDHGAMRSLEDSLSVPGERVFEEVERRLAQLKVLQRGLEQQRVGAVREQLLQKAAKPDMAGSVKILVERVDGVRAAELRELADVLRQKLGSGVVVLGRADGEKASLLVSVTRDLAERIPAGVLVRELGPIIGGAGGGRPDLAEAGGKDPGRLDEALRTAVRAIEKRAEAIR